MGYPAGLYLGMSQALLTEGYLVTRGFPRVNGVGSYESHKLTFRKSIKFSTKPVSTKDEAQAAFVHGYDVEIAAEEMQTSAANLLNALKRAADGPMQFFGKDINGKYWNFQAPAGTEASPTAANYVSLDPLKFSKTNDDSLLTYTLKTWLTEGQMKYLFGTTSTGAYGTDETGGTSLSLTQITKATTGVPIHGFKSVSIGGTTVHIKSEQTSFELETMQKPYSQGLNYSNRLKIAGKIDLASTLPATVLQLVTDTRSRPAIVMTDKNDIPWTFASGSVGFEPEHTEWNNENSLVLSFSGEIPMTFGSGACIDFSTIGTPTFNQGHYS